MRYDFQFFALMVMLGLVTKRLDWRGWFFLLLVVFGYILFNWQKG